MSEILFECPQNLRTIFLTSQSIIITEKSSRETANIPLLVGLKNEKINFNLKKKCFKLFQLFTFHGVEQFCQLFHSIQSCGYKRLYRRLKLSYL